MSPAQGRLICRAHNHYSPATALWNHFVAPSCSLAPKHRRNSTATAPSHNGLSNNSPASQSQNSDVTSSHPVRIRKPKVYSRTWYDRTKKASDGGHPAAKPSRVLAWHDEKHRKSLHGALNAFKASQDYEGVHVRAKEHTNKIDEQNLPWVLDYEERKNLSGLERLNIEIERFSRHARPDSAETIARQHVIAQVREHIQKTNPHLQLEIFGSERMGLAMAISDIDLQLRSNVLEAAETGALWDKSLERSSSQNDLRKLYHRHLKRHDAYLLASIRHARYPLISLQDRRSGLDMQIVCSPDTTVSRKVMADYMEEFPCLRQVYFVAKTTLDVRGLSDVFRGGIGSYSLFMMIVASLKLQDDPKCSAASGLLSFLNFYSNFDTTKKGISICPLWLFDKSEQTIMTHWTAEKLRNGTAPALPPYMLCLRDPADSTNDLGRRGVAIKHVQATFKKLYGRLLNGVRANKRHSLLSPLLGTSFELDRAQRARLRSYGAKLQTRLKDDLAARAERLREEADSGALISVSPTEEERRQEAQRRLETEWQQMTAERNERLKPAAEQLAASQGVDIAAIDFDRFAIRDYRTIVTEGAGQSVEVSDADSVEEIAIKELSMEESSSDTKYISIEPIGTSQAKRSISN